MSAIILLAVQILAVASLPVLPPPGVLAPASHLRGGSVAAPAPAPYAATKRQFVDERGTRGHFYYAESCEDCIYKGGQCGCQAAVEYFACLTKHCHSADHSKFAARCAEVSTSCSAELDIACHGQASTCKGKYNQLPSGALGLTLDLDGVEDNAFCGPFGKCTGFVHMKATIHNPPAQPTLPSLAPAAAPLVAGGIVSRANITNPLFLECGLPIVPNADVDNQIHWTLCRAQVTDDKAGCDLPMFPSLQAGEGREAYCVLTEGTGSLGNPPKRLTQPAWHLISNTHETVPQTTTIDGGSWFR